MRLRQRMNVLLPQPDGPIRAVISCRPISRSTSRTAMAEPYDTDSFSISNTASRTGSGPVAWAGSTATTGATSAPSAVSGSWGGGAGTWVVGTSATVMPFAVAVTGESSEGARVPRLLGREGSGGGMVLTIACSRSGRR